MASGVIVLPLRNPVILAEELASVDVISNGRLIAGFAAGYVAAEFAAAGVPMTAAGHGWTTTSVHCGRSGRWTARQRGVRVFSGIERPPAAPPAGLAGWSSPLPAGPLDKAAVALFAPR